MAHKTLQGTTFKASPDSSHCHGSCLVCSTLRSLPLDPLLLLPLRPLLPAATLPLLLLSAFVFPTSCIAISSSAAAVATCPFGLLHLYYRDPPSEHCGLHQPICDVLGLHNACMR